jgi:uncharacterized RDD family membrane protein YckC
MRFHEPYDPYRQNPGTGHPPTFPYNPPQPGYPAQPTYPGPYPAAGPPYRPMPRDGDPGTRGQRLLAWAIDASLISIVVASLFAIIGVAVANRLQQDAPDIIFGMLLAGLFGGEDALMAQAGHTLTSVAWPFGVIALLCACLQFAYQATTLRRYGRTPGKHLMGLEVRMLSAPNTPAFMPQPPSIAFRRAALVTATETGIWALAYATALLFGLLGLGILLFLIGLTAFWINVAWLLLGDRQSLVDRLCGTVVVRSTARGYS